MTRHHHSSLKQAKKGTVTQNFSSPHEAPIQLQLYFWSRFFLKICFLIGPFILILRDTSSGLGTYIFGMKIAYVYFQRSWWFAKCLGIFHLICARIGKDRHDYHPHLTGVVQHRTDHVTCPRSPNQDQACISTSWIYRTNRRIPSKSHPFLYMASCLISCHEFL